jgi:hypothetical protein
MSNSTTSTPAVVEALIKRVAALEARVARLERPPEPAEFTESGRLTPTQLAERSAMLSAKMRASLEFSRREQLDDLRQDPKLLAAFRADRARRNEFYVARGLAPDPDPYPELP